MISGFVDVSLSPKPFIFLWRHQDAPKNPRRNSKSLLNMSLGDLRFVNVEIVGHVGPTHFKILEFKQMKFGNFQTLNLRDLTFEEFETFRLCDFETKKHF